MTIKTKAILQVSVVVLLTLIWVMYPMSAMASWNKNKSQTQSQEQGQEQVQVSSQGQTQTSNNNIETSATGTGMASNEGNNTEINSRTENNSSNIVLVPNNNTESCIRVWGISFGKDGTAGALGVPWRSAPCDFEQAADDAFAAGERDLGWFWKCKSKNLYKQFKAKGDNEEQAENKCYSRMMAGVSQAGIIHTLEERLTEIMSMRETELTQYKESRERLTQMCNESKNKILAVCTTK